MLRRLGHESELRDILQAAYDWGGNHLGSSYPVDHTYSRVFQNKIYHLAYMVDLVHRSRGEAPLIA